MASIFERVLARQPEYTTSGQTWFKWESRWVAGLWIGKQSQSDDHLIVRNISEINGKTLEFVVSAHRSIRRLQPNDPNRWDRREILELMATPWTHKVSKMTLEQEKLKVKDMANIKPMRLRPLTPDCTACAHHGRAAHGFRHSVVCQKRRHECLAEQEEPPLAKAVRAQ